MAKINLQRGFTLVELLVVAALMAILSGGIVGVFIVTVRGGIQAKLQANLKAQGDRLMTTMERNLRNSITPFTYNAPAETLNFSVRNGDVSVNQYYQRIGNTILFSDGTAPSALLTDPKITSLSWTVTPIPGNAFTPGSVVIVVNMTMSDSGVTVSQQFRSSVAMRNL